MDAERRRERLVQLVTARGAARVSDLAAELGVADVTARRDVELLARTGLLERRHGEVRPPAPRPGPDGPALAGRTVTAVTGALSAYLSEVLLAARDAVVAAGGRFVLEVAPDAPSVRDAVERAARDDGALGVLHAPRWRSAEEAAAESAAGFPGRLPVVLVERFPLRGTALARRDAVRGDHASGVHQALAHLQEAGHRRVLVAARDDSPTARTVRACAGDALRSLGLPVLGEPLLSADGADAHRRLRAPDWAEAVRRHRATAMLVHSDVDALALVPRLRFAGLSVPEDVSVVAYDDVVAGLGDVQLTAVAPPKAEVGRAAVDLLRWRAADPDAPVRRVEVGPHLVRRSSVRAVDQG
ncbi:substrate-binding domain-containing protein [Kineococcus terrestris]|uniref:substrate-binding domain-containing protein n=1 Tax=Kineococcus terrestris TaxID=2044856 RepID=UPI0034DAD7FC